MTSRPSRVLADRRPRGPGRAQRPDYLRGRVQRRPGRGHEQHQGLPLAAEWLAQGRVHPGLILLPSARTRTRSATAAVAAAIENALRDHPDGLSVSERWIGPLPDA